MAETRPKKKEGAAAWLARQERGERDPGVSWESIQTDEPPVQPPKEPKKKEGVAAWLAREEREETATSLPTTAPHVDPPLGRELEATREAMQPPRGLPKSLLTKSERAVSGQPPAQQMGVPPLVVPEGFDVSAELNKAAQDEQREKYKRLKELRKKVAARRVAERWGQGTVFSPLFRGSREVSSEEKALERLERDIRPVDVQELISMAQKVRSQASEEKSIRAEAQRKTLIESIDNYMSSKGLSSTNVFTPPYIATHPSQLREYKEAEPGDLVYMVGPDGGLDVAPKPEPEEDLLEFQHTERDQREKLRPMREQFWQLQRTLEAQKEYRRLRGELAEEQEFEIGEALRAFAGRGLTPAELERSAESPGGRMVVGDDEWTTGFTNAVSGTLMSVPALALDMAFGPLDVGGAAAEQLEDWKFNNLAVLVRGVIDPHGAGAFGPVHALLGNVARASKQYEKEKLAAQAKGFGMRPRYPNEQGRPVGAALERMLQNVGRWEPDFMQPIGGGLVERDGVTVWEPSPREGRGVAEGTFMGDLWGNAWRNAWHIVSGFAWHLPHGAYRAGRWLTTPQAAGAFTSQVAAAPLYVGKFATRRVEQIRKEPKHAFRTDPIITALDIAIPWQALKGVMMSRAAAAEAYAGTRHAVNTIRRDKLAEIARLRGELARISRAEMSGLSGRFMREGASLSRRTDQIRQRLSTLRAGLDKAPTADEIAAALRRSPAKVPTDPAVVQTAENLEFAKTAQLSEAAAVGAEGRAAAARAAASEAKVAAALEEAELVYGQAVAREASSATATAQIVEAEGRLNTARAAASPFKEAIRATWEQRMDALVRLVNLRGAPGGAGRNRLTQAAHQELSELTQRMDTLRTGQRAFRGPRTQRTPEYTAARAEVEAAKTVLSGVKKHAREQAKAYKEFLKAELTAQKAEGRVGAAAHKELVKAEEKAARLAKKRGETHAADVQMSTKMIPNPAATAEVQSRLGRAETYEKWAVFFDGVARYANPLWGPWEVTKAIASRYLRGWKLGRYQVFDTGAEKIHKKVQPPHADVDRPTLAPGESLAAPQYDLTKWHDKSYLRSLIFRPSRIVPELVQAEYQIMHYTRTKYGYGMASAMRRMLEDAHHLKEYDTLVPAFREMLHMEHLGTLENFVFNPGAKQFTLKPGLIGDELTQARKTLAFANKHAPDVITELQKISALAKKSGAFEGKGRPVWMPNLWEGKPVILTKEKFDEFVRAGQIKEHEVALWQEGVHPMVPEALPNVRAGYIKDLAKRREGRPVMILEAKYVLEGEMARQNLGLATRLERQVVGGAVLEATMRRLGWTIEQREAMGLKSNLAEELMGGAQDAVRFFSNRVMANELAAQATISSSKYRKGWFKWKPELAGTPASQNMWGDLAGKYVQPDTYWFLKHLEDYQRWGQSGGQRVLQFLKGTKTVYMPGTTSTNWVGSTMLLGPMVGFLPWLPKNIAKMKTVMEWYLTGKMPKATYKVNGKVVKRNGVPVNPLEELLFHGAKGPAGSIGKSELVEQSERAMAAVYLGAYGRTKNIFAAMQELAAVFSHGDSAITRYSKEVRRAALKEDWWGRGRAEGSAAMGNLAKTFHQGMQAFYTAGDDVNRFAAGWHLLETGMDITKAVEAVRVGFGKYEDLPHMLQMVRRSWWGEPFVAFDGSMLGPMIEKAILQPLVAMLIARWGEEMGRQNLLAAGIDMEALAAMTERLPHYYRGPMRSMGELDPSLAVDENGKLNFIDLVKYLPGGYRMKMPNENNFEWVGRTFLGKNFALAALHTYIGWDMHFKRKIEWYDAMDRFASLVSPGYLPYYGYPSVRIRAALAGRPRPGRDDPESVWRAVLASVLGFRTLTLSGKESDRYHGLGTKWAQRELTGALRWLKRNKGSYSDEEYKERKGYIDEEIKDFKARRDALIERGMKSASDYKEERGGEEFYKQLWRGRTEGFRED